MSAPTIILNNGKTIPQIGLGTSPLNDKEVVPLVVAAIEAGYRHIDTAYRYNNEKGVGQGIRDSGIDRESLFVTTKLDGQFQGNDRAIGGLDESLRRLGLEYVDLLLIHWPLPQRNEYISTWKTFEKLLEAGKARSIGLSNFKPAHIEKLLAKSTIRPAINQIQLNPRITRPEQRSYNGEQGIITEAWSPLGAGNDLLENPTLATIAAKYGKTPGQVVLRWHIELGIVAIPRSANPRRIAQNIDIFDFALTSDEIAAISSLDTGDEQGVDSDKTGH
ncbi:MAG: aldo/keto reductase [Anaerolineae bacterium]|nr:aldo/keto reductase [Anaerolineae bacterium]MCI0609790.1 aldo/keto reductase [Anaerolineae bacterium]